jgi:flagellar hook protein FlgE
MIDAITSSLNGMTAAREKLDRAAQNIAQIGTDIPQADSIDLSTEAVNLMVSRTSFTANAATLRTAQDMTEDLLRMFDKKV